MPIDYKAESQRLDSFVPGESSEFWKPKPGQYRIRALGELEPTKPFQKKDASGKVTEEHEQVELSILLDDKQYKWTMGKGKTPASTYGQLVQLAKAYNNTLKNVDFMVVVVTDKNKNRCTIVKL